MGKCKDIHLKGLIYNNTHFPFKQNLQELYRVLKPGGYIELTEVCHTCIQTLHINLKRYLLD